MNKRTAAALIAGGAALILDSRCAAQSARDALDLCARTLVPSLFPLLVIGAALVPSLGSVRIPILARTLGIPSGSEGIWLLGAFGGFPVGAASIAQSVESGALTKSDGERMLEQSSAQRLYSALGRHLKYANGWKQYVITSEPEFEHYFGRRADKKRKFYNGKIKCDYYMFTDTTRRKK